MGIRAGILAGASAAVLAVPGLGARSAMATPACPGGTVVGQGSTLQKNAQVNTWTPTYNSHCGMGSVTYTGTGSGAGLEAFGFTGLPIDPETQFIGTDEAPEAAQIAVSDALSKTHAVIVPVTQTAIAVVIHPPAGCQFEEEAGITWKDLNKAFGGNGLTNWSQFEGIEATIPGACNVPLTRVVRTDASGTTYQFKNYLSALETREGAEGLPCETGGHNHWAELRKNNGGSPAPNPNVTWPECNFGTKVIRADSNARVAETVEKTAGTIGYADLPGAKGKGASVAELQNGSNLGSPLFAAPDNTSNDTARCVDSRYTVPSNASNGIDVDWSTAFGAVPNIGGEEYPLCTLTFDLGFQEATKAGYTAKQAAEVADYIKYEVNPSEGQTDLIGTWYSALPTNVQTAATIAASKLG